MKPKSSEKIVVSSSMTSSKARSSKKIRSSSSIKKYSKKKVRVKKEKKPAKVISSSKAISSSSLKVLSSKARDLSFICLTKESEPKTRDDYFKCSRSLWTNAKTLGNKTLALRYLQKARSWYDNGSLVYEIAKIEYTRKAWTSVITKTELVLSKRSIWDHNDFKKSLELKIKALSQLQKQFPSRANKSKLTDAIKLYKSK